MAPDPTPPKTGSKILSFFRQASATPLPAIPKDSIENLVEDVNHTSPFAWKRSPSSLSLSALIALPTPDIKLQNEQNPRSIVGTGALFSLNASIPSLPAGVRIMTTLFSASDITCAEDCAYTQFKRFAVAVDTTHEKYDPRLTREALQKISEVVAPHVERFQTLHKAGKIPGEAYDLILEDPVLDMRHR